MLEPNELAAYPPLQLVETGDFSNGQNDQPTPEDYAGGYLFGDVLPFPNAETEEQKTEVEQTPEVSLIETLRSLKQDFNEIRQSLAQTRAAIRQLGAVAIEIRRQLEETDSQTINGPSIEPEPVLEPTPEPVPLIEYQPEEILDPEPAAELIKEHPESKEPALPETLGSYDGYIYRAYFPDGLHAVKVVGGGERQGQEYLEIINWDDPGQTHQVFLDEFEHWNRPAGNKAKGIKNRISRGRDKVLDVKDTIYWHRRHFNSRLYYGVSEAVYKATTPYHRAKRRLSAKLQVGYRLHEGLLKLGDLEDAAND